MSENNVRRTDINNIQQLAIGGCTYEIRAIFGSKLKLEDIIAQRVLRDPAVKHTENQAAAACSAEHEASWPDK